MPVKPMKSALLALRLPRQQLSMPRVSIIATSSANMSTTNQPNSASTPQDTPTTRSQTPHDDQKPDIKTPLPLPEPDSSNTTRIDMSNGGSTVKLDHLGPLVVNKDGTLSRIANWEQMAEIEKQNTLRILGKRNMLRREALKNGEGGDGVGAGAGA
jgi:hypothetical protein